MRSNSFINNNWHCYVVVHAKNFERSFILTMKKVSDICPSNICKQPKTIVPNCSRYTDEYRKNGHHHRISFFLALHDKGCSWMKINYVRAEDVLLFSYRGYVRRIPRLAAARSVPSTYRGSRSASIWNSSGRVRRDIVAVSLPVVTQRLVAPFDYDFCARERRTGSVFRIVKTSSRFRW